MAITDVGISVSPRRVQHNEHDLRIGGGAGLAIQRLELTHRIEPEWRGGVIEPQHVGGDIHHHRALRRMALRHAGEEVAQ